MNLAQAALALQNGQDIEELIPVGGSMAPVIKSRQPVTVKQIVDPSTLKKGDIVLVKVKSNIYLHFVTAVQPQQVQIGNNHGRINGWTSLQNVFGIVTAIEGVQRRNSQYKTAG